MLQKPEAWSETELSHSHSPLAYVRVSGHVEIKGSYDTKFCSCSAAVRRMPVDLSDTAYGLNLAKEALWTSKETETSKRESMKKGAGRVAQRRTDNKRRMRRQFPDDAYVWETDTSPGMG